MSTTPLRPVPPGERDPRVAALLDALRRSFDGDAWHGPALADALRGLDARAAAAHPIPGAHSVWELTQHLAAWTREVARRLGGRRSGEPAEGDWPAAPPALDDPAWDALRRDLDAARDALLAAVAAIAPEQLDRPLARPADGAPAEAIPADRPTYGRMLAGLAEHNAYHGGQIALLRRALGAPPHA